MERQTRFNPSYRNIWFLSFPLIIASISETIVGLTDTIFLSHYGVTELAALGLADAIYALSLFLIAGFVDGIQINELNSGGFYAGGQFNLSNVKRIEDVYGPASVLYGTNAISGIINIIFNDPEDIRGGHASVLFGNFGTRNYDFKYGYYNQKRIGLISVSHNKQGGASNVQGSSECCFGFCRGRS